MSSAPARRDGVRWTGSTEVIGGGCGRRFGRSHKEADASACSSNYPLEQVSACSREISLPLMSGRRHLSRGAEVTQREKLKYIYSPTVAGRRSVSAARQVG